MTEKLYPWSASEYVQSFSPAKYVLSFDVCIFTTQKSSSQTKRYIALISREHLMFHLLQNMQQLLH